MKRIYVNKKAVDRMKSGGKLEPCIVIREGGSFTHASQCQVLGPSRFVHDPHAPEGPTIWIETEADVKAVP